MYSVWVILETMRFENPPPVDVLTEIFSNISVQYVRRKGPEKIRIEFRRKLTDRDVQFLAAYGIKARPGQRMVTYQW